MKQLNCILVLLVTCASVLAAGVTNPVSSTAAVDDIVTTAANRTSQSLVYYNPLAKSVTYPALTTIGHVRIGDNNFGPLTQLKSVSFPELQWIDGQNNKTFSIFGVPNLESLSLPKLTSGVLAVHNTKLSSLALPLKTAGDIDVADNPLLASLILPASGIAGKIRVSRTALTSLTLHGVTGLIADACSHLTSLSDSDVGRVLVIQNTPVTGSFTAGMSSNPVVKVRNTNLNSITLNGIAYFYFGNAPSDVLEVANNPSLTSIAFGGGEPLSFEFYQVATFNFSSNALTATCVNNLLVLLNGLTTTGAGSAVTVNVSGGTNAAPTGAGLTAKAAMIAKGYTVLTN